jgi:hypothetical protein
MCTVKIAKKMHCKDANTVYISVQSILLVGNFGKRGKAKRKTMETGRIRILLNMKILREKKTKKENFIIDVYCQKDAL